MRQACNVFALLFLFLSPPASADNYFQIQWQENPDLRRQLRNEIEGRLFKLEPMGDHLLSKKQHCSAIEISKNIFPTFKKPHLQEQKTLSLIEQCTSEKSSPVKSYLDIIFGNQVYYNFLDIKDVHIVHFFNDADKVTIQGVLALKPSVRPLPLVIYQCGVFCEIGSPMFSKALTQVFDEGPFHVLAIPNSTSKTFLRNNQNYVLGGLVEGRFLYEISKAIADKTSPVRERISGVHLMGDSFGAHSALAASLYFSYDGNLRFRPLINSVVLSCPVVDLQASIRDVTANKSIAGRYFYHLFWSLFHDFFGQFPIFKDIFRNIGSQPKLEEMNKVLNPLIEAYYSQKPRGWFPEPWYQHQFQTAEEVYEESKLQNKALALKVPTTVWAALDDPVVRTRNNTIPLQKKMQQSRGNQIARFVISNRGSHCQFHMPYAWSVSGTLQRSYLIADDKTLLSQVKIERFPIPKGKIPMAFGVWPEGGLSFSGGWRAAIGQSTIFLTLWNQDGKAMAVPFSYKELKLNKATPPRNRAESASLTRYLNANYRILNSQGKPWAGHPRNPPTQIERVDYGLESF